MASRLNSLIRKVYDRTIKEADRPVSIPSQVVNINKSSKFVLNRFLKTAKEKIKPELKWLLLAIPIISIFLIGWESQHKLGFGSRAGLHNAQVSFQVSSWNLPPENSFEVWINPDYAVDFVNVSIQFDPNLVKLSNEIVLGTSLARNVKVTTMNEANQTGVITIVAALDPSQRGSAPTSPFKLASMPFNANTTGRNVTTTINFNTSKSQIVGSDQTEFNIAASALSLTLNPATPVTSPVLSTPTPTPGVSTATPTPKGKGKGGGVGGGKK